jgi:methylmalonyl-CoA mutase cobalamin-binding domain/chain
MAPNPEPRPFVPEHFGPLDSPLDDMVQRSSGIQSGLSGHNQPSSHFPSSVKSIQKQRPPYTEMITNAAIQEDVDVVGLSILSGAHLSLTQRVLDNLKAKGAGDKMVLAGGVISPTDAGKLKEMGVAEVFIPGTPIKTIADFIRKKFAG